MVQFVFKAAESLRDDNLLKRLPEYNLRLHTVKDSTNLMQFMHTHSQSYFDNFNF